MRERVHDTRCEKKDMNSERKGDRKDGERFSDTFRSLMASKPLEVNPS